MENHFNNIEIRPNEDGTIDEIVLLDTDGRVVFHLEQMDDTDYWVGLYDYTSRGTDNCTHIRFSIQKGTRIIID